MTSGPAPQAFEAVVVTVSTRAASGERPDTVGPAVVARLATAGWAVAPEPIVLPDGEVQLVGRLTELASTGYRLIVTTGGTGLSPTDRTPEATGRVADYLVPGISEVMRAAGRASTPLAALSRGVAAVRRATLILNLPGSPHGAVESLEAVLPILRHAVEQLGGGDHVAGVPEQD